MPVLLGACVERPCPRADLSPLPAIPRYAVVTGDYASTAIALLDADGAFIREAWIDSGTEAPRVSATLSGDVSLPSVPLGAGVLSLIDRFGVDRITRIRIPSGEVLGQISARLPAADGAGAFRANPHDALLLDDGTLLVSRFSRNEDPSAPDRGNDLLRVDVATGQARGRIDLSALDDGERYARPDRMARFGRFVVVGLARLSRDFRDIGAGAIAVVDLDRDTAVAFPIPPLTNCGDVAAVPSGARRVLVTCSGATFADLAGAAGPEMRRAGAGVALIDVSAEGEPSLFALRAAARDARMPPPSPGSIAISDEEAVYPAMGAYPSTGDRLVRLDLTTGEFSIVAETPSPFVLAGRGVFDPERHLLLVPDREDGIRRFRISDDGVERLGNVKASTCRGLPAIEIARLTPP